MRYWNGWWADNWSLCQKLASCRNGAGERTKYACSLDQKLTCHWLANFYEFCNCLLKNFGRTSPLQVAMTTILTASWESHWKVISHRMITHSFGRECTTRSLTAGYPLANLTTLFGDWEVSRWLSVSHYPSAFRLICHWEKVLLTTTLCLELLDILIPLQQHQCWLHCTPIHVS